MTVKRISTDPEASQREDGAGDVAGRHIRRLRGPYVEDLEPALEFHAKAFAADAGKKREA